MDKPIVNWDHGDNTDASLSEKQLESVFLLSSIESRPIPTFLTAVSCLQFSNEKITICLVSYRLIRIVDLYLYRPQPI